MTLIIAICFSDPQFETSVCYFILCSNRPLCVPTDHFPARHSGDDGWAWYANATQCTEGHFFFVLNCKWCSAGAALLLSLCPTYYIQTIPAIYKPVNMSTLRFLWLVVRRPSHLTGAAVRRGHVFTETLNTEHSGTRSSLWLNVKLGSVSLSTAALDMEAHPCEPS